MKTAKQYERSLKKTCVGTVITLTATGLAFAGRAFATAKPEDRFYLESLVVMLFVFAGAIVYRDWRR